MYAVQLAGPVNGSACGLVTVDDVDGFGLLDDGATGSTASDRSLPMSVTEAATTAAEAIAHARPAAVRRRD
ncbi:MAG TPA: hypothetical protein VK640_03205 [Actinomycetes bacterium]|nr:hypothetical protein [Actinomycetes bacterium]